MRNPTISHIMKGLTAGTVGAGLVALAAQSALADLGHGRGQDSGQVRGTYGHVASLGGEPGSMRDVDRTVVVESHDLEYSIESLEVRDGETIRFVIRNASEIEHDFTIGTPEVQRAHRKQMEAMMSKMADGDTAMRHDHPNAVFVRSGETRELIWTFKRSAKLEFGCNVPGHYEAGMRGKITFVN